MEKAHEDTRTRVWSPESRWEKKRNVLAVVACTCNPSAVLMRPGDPWPVSLFYAVSERPRDSKMNQGANAWGKLPKTDLWPPHIHACIPAHTWISHASIRTEGAGEVFVLPTQVVCSAVRSSLQTGSAVYDMPVAQRLDGTNLNLTMW